MGEEDLMVIRKNICDHYQQRRYQQKRLDILNGFELVLTRCINCHKVLSLEARKIKKTEPCTSNDNSWLIKLTKLFKNLFNFTRKIMKYLRLFGKKIVYRSSKYLN